MKIAYDAKQIRILFGEYILILNICSVVLREKKVKERNKQIENKIKGRGIPKKSVYVHTLLIVG